MRTQKLEIADPVNGFTERDPNSKAILNTDVNSLLKYKIQRRKFSEINKTKDDISVVRAEVESIKADLCEIRELLLQIKQR